MGDMTCSNNATLGNFTVHSASVYTVELTPTPGLLGAVMALNLTANKATDTAGNGNTAAEQLSVWFDSVPPSIEISTPSAPSTAAGPVTYTVTYTGAEGVDLTESEVHLITSGDVNARVTVSDVGAKADITKLITLDNITGEGALSISIDAGTSLGRRG